MVDFVAVGVELVAAVQRNNRLMMSVAGGGGGGVRVDPRNEMRSSLPGSRGWRER